MTTDLRPTPSALPDTAPPRPSAASTYLGVPAAGGLVAAAVVGVRSVASPAAAAVLGVVLAVAAALLVRRRPPAADHVGAAALVGLAAGLTAGTSVLADTRQHALSLASAVVALVALSAIAAFVVQQSASGRPRAEVLRSILRPFEAPTSTWGMGLIGAALAIPLVGTYSPTISESDSAWLVVSTGLVRSEGTELLRQNQDVLLPHLVLSPLLEHGGYAAAIAFTILSTVALAAFTAVLAFRVCGSLIGTTVAVGALLSFPELAARSDRLPMYSIMLLLGYGAGALLHKAMSPGRPSRWYAVAAGVAVMACIEAHSVGQLFLMLPFLMVVLHPWERARGPLAVTVATMLVAGIPRVAINLSEGGLTAFRSNYTDFMIQQGYLRMVNRDFWGQNVDASPLGYLTNVPALARGAFGQMSFAAVVVIAAYAGIRTRGRARLFAVTAASAYLLALAVASPGTYSRYFLPLSVGLAIVAGVGATKALTSRADGQLFGALLSAVVVLGAIVNVGTYTGQAAELNRAVLSGSWPIFAGIVDDGTSVLGVRSHELVWTDPTIGAQFSRTLDEADFVTYLTWPSDDEVLAMMDRIGSGWIFINSQQSLETDYHQTWVGPTYGLTVRHVRQVALSDAFCLVAEIDGRRLYRVGGCPGGFLPGPYEPADLDGDGVPDALEPRLGVDDYVEPEAPTDDPDLTEPGAVDGPDLGTDDPPVDDPDPDDPSGDGPLEAP